MHQNQSNYPIFFASLEIKHTDKKGSTMNEYVYATAKLNEWSSSEVKVNPI